jgi:hypothetical protein
MAHHLVEGTDLQVGRARCGIAKASRVLEQ